MIVIEAGFVYSLYVVDSYNFFYIYIFFNFFFSFFVTFSSYKMFSSVITFAVDKNNDKKRTVEIRFAGCLHHNVRVCACMHVYI